MYELSIIKYYKLCRYLFFLIYRYLSLFSFYFIIYVIKWNCLELKIADLISAAWCEWLLLASTRNYWQRPHWAFFVLFLCLRICVLCTLRAPQITRFNCAPLRDSITYRELWINTLFDAIAKSADEMWQDSIISNRILYIASCSSFCCISSGKKYRILFKWKAQF